MKTIWVRGGAVAVLVVGLAALAGKNLAADANDATPADAVTTAVTTNSQATDTTAAPAADNPTAAPMPAAAPATAPAMKLSEGAASIVKLAQAGLGDDVMMAYVGNEMSKFNLGSDEIVYLNDLGVSGTVVKAMIERDSYLDAQSQAAVASLVPPNMQPPTMPPPTAPPDDYSTAPTPPPLPDDSSMADNPPQYPSNYTQPDDADYFYSSLVPFGGWFYASGVGLCWQPTVCRVNPQWAPYCDRGRWLASDCGWYWQSDYSWGWAAFHYGRWFHDSHKGWCWAPDKTWGPAWVSWRRSADMCGWAPLPPAARFVPGAGLSYANHLVAANFDFNIRPDQYTFIPIARLSDYTPARYSVPSWEVGQVYAQSTLINHFSANGNHVVSHGIDPKEVAAASHTEVRQAQVREVAPEGGRLFQSDRVSKVGGGMVIYRPQLPPPSAKRNLNRTTQNTQPGGNSVAVVGQRSSTPPLPNMNFSYQAGRSSATYETVRPVANYGTYGASSPAPAPNGDRPSAGFDFNYARNAQTAPAAPTQQFAPNQNSRAAYYYNQRGYENGNQNPYLIPGRFTAADQMRGNGQGNFSAPNQQFNRTESQQNNGYYNMPGRYSANEQLNGNSQNNSSPANTVMEHARAEAGAAYQSRQTQNNSTPAPAPAPASSESSSSSSSSSQQQSGHR